MQPAPDVPLKIIHHTLRLLFSIVSSFCLEEIQEEKSLWLFAILFVSFFLGLGWKKLSRLVVDPSENWNEVWNWGMGVKKNAEVITGCSAHK